MLFNSLTYLFFLFAVVIMFWNFSHKGKFYLIFISSLIFYGFWKVEFILLLLFSTTLDWWIAQKIYETNGRTKKKYLIFSLTTNLSLLFYFKYLIFFSKSAIGFANLIGFEIDSFVINIILPLGISFYTFQTISYVIDVYRRVIKPEKNYILYASYVTFFPQLVAGPILRAREVIPQFKKKNIFKWIYIYDGFRRILYGLFLKVVIADNIAPIVDTGFNLPLETLSAFDVWTLAFLFGFQIYFDFSGYSHIALGSAKLLGINFPENFNFPYLASSPKDFWRRWHISLSSWVRDYIYLPLSNMKFQNTSLGGLSKVTNYKKDLKPLFITWGLMGLWHGANWTFVLWGIYHAVLIFFYRKILYLNKDFKENNNIFLGWLITLPMIMLSWIPFRTNSITEATKMWVKIINPFEYDTLNLHENAYLLATLLLIGVILTYCLKLIIKKKKIALHYLIFLSDIVLISLIFYLTFIFLRPINQFIYFQF